MKRAAVLLSVFLSLALGGLASADSISDMGNEGLKLQQAMDQKAKSDSEKANTFKALSDVRRTVVTNLK